jgi:hypothetical protein
MTYGPETVQEHTEMPNKGVIDSAFAKLLRPRLNLPLFLMDIYIFQFPNDE